MVPSLTRLRGRRLRERAELDLLDLADAASRHWVRNPEVRDRIERRLEQRRRTSQHRLAPFLQPFAELNPTARFIQIGADESVRNPLRPLILNYGWSGLIIEPIPGLIEKLKRTYGQLERIKLVRAAIAPMSGQATFYYVDRHPGAGLDDPDARAAATKGSLRREVLFLAPNFATGLDERIAEVEVPRVTFDDTCAEHGIEALDVLVITTEGDEAEILEQIDLARHGPALLLYSHDLLGPGVRQRSLDRLASLGYEYLETEGRTWALNPRFLGEGQAPVLVPIWRWVRRANRLDQPFLAIGILRAVARHVRGHPFGNGAAGISFPLAEHERRYLSSGYDARTPLSSQDSAFLSPDNPRLLELQRQYKELDLPAIRHHLWVSSRVTAHVDLKYFRGDNLYVWHYPEHPRAMALKLFVYLRYIEGRGGGRLLRALPEDGAFGCWTAEVAGFGKVSRDQLDAANEILFLERELGLLSRERLRVLDIGAGYGRLALRMAQAVPGLTDYCCVDAVPESTFLSEFYLKFRGCSPPARTVPLPEFSRLEPDQFDLAVNIHSFSECTIEAIHWWVQEIRRLRIPHLFVVPNEADGILSSEPDGSYHSALPVLEEAGYLPVTKERAIGDQAVRHLARIMDNFYLFSLTS
jgi:FkbM family methyltransferase